MIAESCPSPPGILKFGYTTWNQWFVHYLNYIKKKNIKAFSYINCNWDNIKQFKSIHWGDTRIQNFPKILTLWTNELSKDIYLKASPNLFQILGYTNQ